MALYNTVPHDEGLPLKPKKVQHLTTGLVVAAAAIAFSLGVVAATAPPVKPAGAAAPTQLSSGPAMPEYWWQGPTSWKTVSPVDDGCGIDCLKDYVDTLYDGGVLALALNSAYESGAGAYPPGKLWDGLAMSEPHKVSSAIGTEDDFKALAKKLHDKGMALITWLNPSYFWTASPHFQQAEQDMKDPKFGNCASNADPYNCALNIKNSPAAWFSWAPLNFAWENGLEVAGYGGNCYGGKGADYAPASIGNKDIQECFTECANDAQCSGVTVLWINKPKEGIVECNLRGGIDLSACEYDDKNPEGYVTYTKPQDSHPAGGKGGYTGRYVADFDAGALYLSFWADQPSADMASEEWQNELKNIISHWIGLGVDGFIFDDPEGYLSAGYYNAPGYNHADSKNDGAYWEYDGGATMKAVISDPVRELGKGKVAAFGESPYMVPERTVAYGLDGSIADIAEETKSGLVIANAINDAHASGLDGVFSQAGGVDAYIAQCYFTQPKFCPVALGRPGFSVDMFGGFSKKFGYNNEPKKLELAMAVTVGGGFVADVEWWNYGFPREEGDPAMQSLFWALESSDAFKPLALRTKLDVDKGDAYAMMKYDAIGTGEAGIAVYNLGPKKQTISVTMPAAAILGGFAKDLVSGKQLSALGDTYDVEVPGQGYVLLGNLYPGTWKSQGYKNCYDGHGASGSSNPVGTGPLTIAACMDKCLESDKSKCGGVTVAWTEDGNGTVECYLRSNIDIGSCEDGQKDKKQWYTTFTRD